MGKAKITRNQANSIESYLRHNSKRELLEGKMRGNTLTGDWCYVNGMDFDKLAQALYSGYEIEKTPAEKIKEYYDEVSEDYYESPRNSFAENTASSKRIAIKKVLNYIGLEIEGVNV